MFRTGRRVPNDAADLYLGLYILDLLQHYWVHRRVDTIQLLDDVTINHRVTIDVNRDELVNAVQYWGLNNGDVLRSDEVVPAPLALLRKDLMMETDFTGPTGLSLPIPPRNQDSYAAACAMFALAVEKSSSEVTREVAENLYNIAHGFPAEARELVHPPDGWHEAAKQQWTALVNDSEFVDLLYLFAETFILFGSVGPSATGANSTGDPLGDDPQHEPGAPESGILLYKFSYLMRADIGMGPGQAWGFRALQLPFRMLGGQTHRSFHLRLTAPDELNIVRIATETPSPRWQGRWKQAHNRAHVHITGWDLETPGLIAYLRPVSWGSLRNFLIAIWIVTLVQLGAFIAADTIREIARSQNADAAIAILLSIPAVVTAYMSRPSPHRLASRAVDRVRFVTGLGAALPYTTAIHLLLANKASETFLAVLLSLAIAATVYVSSIWVIAWVSQAREPHVVMSLET